MKLIIAGGGTGGHLYPGIAVAEEFCARNCKNELLFVGVKRGIEARVLPEQGWPVRFVSSGFIKGRGWFGVLKGVLKTGLGILQSLGIVLSFRPSFILGMGGYSSVPMVLAGRLMGVRAAIHEQNAVPGLANRLLGKIVNKVFIAYPDCRTFFPDGKTEMTGNPVRKSILGAGREEAEKSTENFTVFVFGGSQGAKKINAVAAKVFCRDEMKRHGIKIIHQTGYDDYESVANAYRNAGVNAEVYPFIEDMAWAYGTAGLVICRAGAATISELLATGRPSILMPYPYAADDHQRKNAEYVVKNGAARMITDSDLTATRLLEELEELIGDGSELVIMGKNAETLAHSDASARIYEEIVHLVDEK